MNRDELIQEIEEAFADVQYPGDEFIMFHPTHSEAVSVRPHFEGKHWKDLIDPDFLRRNRQLRSFSLDGLRFYLPAYLIGAVRYPFESVEWLDSLHYTLYTQDWDYLRLPFWDQLMKKLTARQKHAIRLFYEYMLETLPDSWWRIPEPPGNELALALANFWNQF
jgi:hypothetical protein